MYSFWCFGCILGLKIAKYRIFWKQPITEHFQKKHKILPLCVNDFFSKVLYLNSAFQAEYFYISWWYLWIFFPVVIVPEKVNRQYGAIVNLQTYVVSYFKIFSKHSYINRITIGQRKKLLIGFQLSFSLTEKWSIYWSASSRTKILPLICHFSREISIRIQNK